MNGTTKKKKKIQNIKKCIALHNGYSLSKDTQQWAILGFLCFPSLYANGRDLRSFNNRASLQQKSLACGHDAQ